MVPNDGLDVLVAATAFDPVTSATSNSVTTFGRGQAPLSPIGTLALPTCLTSVAAVPCTQTPVAGNFSGLHTPGDIAVAPDNTTVLVAAGGVFTTSAQSLTTLTRNVTSGAIAFNRCIAADTAAGPGGSGACSLLASATPGGGNSGQAAAGGVVVSPDNRHVYVPGFFDAAITWYGNDADGDTVGDSIDNCPAAANTNQSDLDADGIGDVCDATPTGPPGPVPPGPAPLAPGGPAATTPAPAAGDT
ncbi:MAG: thrombospondin type 3 repeat-containing protein, partial [Baekduiaceae bacterium]